MAASGDNPIVQYANFSPGDYLVGPERHRLIYYNHSGATADVIANTYVMTIAKFMLEWTAVEDDPAEQKYYQLLSNFAAHGRATCKEAHTELYQLVNELWGIQYHPPSLIALKTPVDGKLLKRIKRNKTWDTGLFRR